MTRKEVSTGVFTTNVCVRTFVELLESACLFLVLCGCVGSGLKPR